MQFRKDSRYVPEFIRLIVMIVILFLMFGFPLAFLVLALITQ